MGKRASVGLFLTLFAASYAKSVFPEDWPMWRYDAKRSAVTPHELPAKLHLLWVRHLPAPRPAWPRNEDTGEKLQFDSSYEPVVSGKTILVPSMVSDRMTAYDTETGREKWRFYADGPVRFAPVAWEGRVYFVSDDGYLYCVDMKNGELVWKFRGCPSPRKVLGNGRLISAWPARGGPVLHNSKIYFAASVWPHMGTFIHARDAKTGKAIWTNSGTGSTYILQPHNKHSFAGVAPQGYLAATDDVLLVPGGRSVPAGYDARSGKLLYFHLEKYRSGGYEVAVHGTNFLQFRNGIYTGMYGLANGNSLVRENIEATLSVFTDKAMTGVSYKRAAGEGLLVSFSILPEKEEYTDRKGKKRMGLKLKLDVQEKLKEKLDEICIKAGSRLYGIDGKGRVVAIDIPSDTVKAKISWSADIEGNPRNMLAADNKLFVISYNGSISCFGGNEVAAKTYVRTTKPLPLEKEGYAKHISALLKRSNLKEGYCLVIGIKDGSLINTVLQSSNLQVIGIDPDKTKINRLRRSYDEAGLYGHRVALHAGDLASFEFPPYIAKLVLSEDLSRAGSLAGEDFLPHIYKPLRPYGGMACLPIPETKRERFVRTARGSGLPGLKIEVTASFVTLTRSGALPGSADWTHQNADPANSLFSKDKLVKAPLGLLWFGGPPNDKTLPRHGHGPSPQVTAGRVIIEGVNCLRAWDVYTGILLWEKELPDIGKFFDNTGHQPGANALGSNYVSMPDAVYVAYKNKILRLNPETGETMTELTLPLEKGDGIFPELGYLGIWKDILLVGTSPAYYSFDLDYNAIDLRYYKDDEAKQAKLINWISKTKNYQFVPKKEDETAIEFLIKNLARLRREEKLWEKLAETPDTKKYAEKINRQRREIEKHLAAGIRKDLAEYLLVQMNAQFLRRWNTLVPKKGGYPGRYNNWSATGSRQLVAINRFSGDVIWSRKAKHNFFHNAIAVGAGKVFCIDKMCMGEISRLERRGNREQADFQILALDVKTGKVIWQTKEDIFGTWLGYSEKYDVLLQATRRSRDMLPEPGSKMTAYQGKSGKIIWSRDIRFSGPCLLHGRTIITQKLKLGGFALDLLSGKSIMRKHPLTGIDIPWTWRSTYGCGTAVASENLLTFRSAAAGYYDLTNKGGTGNLGGFKSGCTSNLIAANGVLNAPDYTRTCTCCYQNQTSLALVHMPEVETWTFNTIKPGKEPVKRVGLNFGAPGDRRAKNGTFWLDYPSVGGPSPDIPVETVPKSPKWFRYHSSRINGKGLKWVAASGVEGLRSLTITLVPGGKENRDYTVRLYFAEPDREGEPGERIFAVSLQGRPVLEKFDLFRAAGGAHRSLVREFRDIKVKDVLTVDLVPAVGVPVISGIEVVASE